MVQRPRSRRAASAPGPAHGCIPERRDDQVIRVIYEWQVDSRNIDAFREAWQKTTTMIHESVPGARGSFLLQEEGNAGRILTVARWDSLEDWQAFWKSEDPPEMLQMRELGKRISVKAYQEFADCTV